MYRIISRKTLYNQQTTEQTLRGITKRQKKEENYEKKTHCLFYILVPFFCMPKCLLYKEKLK